MTVLAIDTATTLCGVAVQRSAAFALPHHAVRRQAVTTHSEMLLPLIDDSLRELGQTPRDLTAVVCGAGPGSFTGLRIGVATAKGLCFALGLPLVMVSSLEALGAQALAQVPRPRPVLATLNAFRGQTFARLVLPAGCPLSAGLSELVADQPRLKSDAVWDPATLAALLQPYADELWLCGGGLLSYPLLQAAGTKVADDDLAPHPLAVLALGLGRLRAGDTDPLVTATPNYICASAAEEAAARGALPHGSVHGGAPVPG